MKAPASSLLASPGFLALMLALTAGHSSHVNAAPITPNTVEPTPTIAADDLVTLERSFSTTRGACTVALGAPTNRVFPDGTRETFVVPAGKAFVVTDIEGDVREKSGAGWFVGGIGILTATLTGTVANQYVRARGQIDSDAATAGIVTVKLHLQSGVVADSGASVCLSAVMLTKNGVHTAQVGTDVRVHGYLIPR
jgi:hypothetical protein